jgi:hypothetical protein
MTSKRISQLDVLAGAAIASDDSFVVFDASASATKRATRGDLAFTLASVMAGAGLTADGLGAIRILPDTNPGSSVLATGSGLSVGVGNTNAEFVGLRSRNQSAGNAATSVAEISTGVANASVRFEVLNNDGAPIGRLVAGSALASFQHRAAVHIFASQTGSTEFGRISSSGLQVGNLIESTSGGFRFPDGSTQTTASAATVDATESVAGRIEIATQAETNNGTDNTRAITPAKLANMAPAEVTYAPGDKLLVLDASDGFRLKQTGSQLGPVVGIYSSLTTATQTTTNPIPFDGSQPQNTEGLEVLSLTFTPRGLGNALKVEVLINGASSAGNITVALFAGTGAGAVAVATHNIINTANAIQHIPLVYYTVASSSTTLRVRVGAASGTFTLNGESGGALQGGLIHSSIYVTEYVA